jgi:hypothetical protein
MIAAIGSVEFAGESPQRYLLCNPKKATVTPIKTTSIALFTGYAALSALRCS